MRLRKYAIPKHKHGFSLLGDRGEIEGECNHVVDGIVGEIVEETA